MNLIGKLKDKNYRGYVVLGFIVLIILIGTGVQYCKQSNIHEFKDKTTGKIIDFEFINMKRYHIRYEYNAKGINYIGRSGVSFFPAGAPAGARILSRSLVNTSPYLSTLNTNLVYLKDKVVFSNEQKL